MGKDKKGKSEGKKAKAAEKKLKQEKKSTKKSDAKSKKERLDDSDAEDNIDLDSVLAEFAKKQEAFLKVTETVCSEPPKPRASSTLIASPENENELFLFGGEYFNGNVVEFYNDLYVYVVGRDEWRTVTSPNSPLPRSGHAWTRGGNAGGVYLFGGEFSSPKQGTFYHYNDVSFIRLCLLVDDEMLNNGVIVLEIGAFNERMDEDRDERQISSCKKWS